MSETLTLAGIKFISVLSHISTVHPHCSTTHRLLKSKKATTLRSPLWGEQFSLIHFQHFFFRFYNIFYSTFIVPFLFCSAGLVAQQASRARERAWQQVRNMCAMEKVLMHWDQGSGFLHSYIFLTSSKTLNWVKGNSWKINRAYSLKLVSSVKRSLVGGSCWLCNF